MGMETEKRMDQAGNSYDDLEAMCRRLTSDLERCHKESVKLVSILLDVAACVGCKRDSNYMTIKELKDWAKAQAEARKLPLMQQTKVDK